MAFLFRKTPFLCKKYPLTKFFTRDAGYIVLIPEIGEDLPEKGSLLQTNGLPEFDSISVEKCMAAIGIQALEFEKGVHNIENILQEKSDADIFSNVFKPLDILGAPLDTTWGLSKTLYLGNNTSMPTNNYLAIHEHAKRARASKYNCVTIYDASKKELVNSNQKYNSEEVRVLKKFVLEGKLNGLELDKSKSALLQENRKKLLEEKSKFKFKVDASTKQFRQVITEFNLVREFPRELLENMANNRSRANEGPWEVTLSPHIYPSFMEHCPDRNLRFNVWLSMVSRGATHRTKELSTSVHVEQIRFLRHDQANILGYDTFVDMSMETKMAGSLSTLKNVLQSLLKTAKPAQEQELNDLCVFAKERGFSGDRLQLWDVPYWSRKINKSSNIKHFKLDDVLRGLFKTCEDLFDVEISQRIDVFGWHKGVKFYDVFERDSREPVAGFYMDLCSDTVENWSNIPYNPKGWMVAIQNKSKIAKTVPLAAVIFNFKASNPLLLDYDEVKQLFYRFGHALQHLLTRTTYAEVAGVSNVEWDAVEVCGHVFSHLFTDTNVLKNISEEEIEIPRNFTAGIDLCRDMYFAALDLELHSSRDFWLDVVKRLWPEFRSFPLDKYDWHPCSFSQIFAEDWGAAYYSHLWSRMIAADVYGAFYETRGNPDLFRATGKRFRDTFLALGGSDNPNEVFRKFRGRDPSHKALLKSLGLKNSQQNQDIKS